MAKASPIVRSLNAGAFSYLLYGRTDLSRYPAAARRMLNFVPTVQGPALARPGTQFVNTVKDETKYTRLEPFVFSDDQPLMLEFVDTGARVWNSEGGLQTHAAEIITPTNNAGDVLTFESATLGASVADQLFLSGFPVETNLNGRICNITAKSGNAYTTDITYPTGTPIVTGSVQRVFFIPCVYNATDRYELRTVQSLDVMYLLNKERPRKLSRVSQLDWNVEDVSFKDGPYMDVNETEVTLAPAETGNGIVDMTGNTAPAGVATSDGDRPAITANNPFLGRTITYDLDAAEPYYAFDADPDTYWAGDKAQKGVLEYQNPAPFICDGYAIHVARDNQDTSYIAKDYAPGTWSFEGFDGSVWHELDRQENYILYDGNKSVFFEIKNNTAYSRYRLNIKRLTRNGPIEPRVGRLVLREKDASFNVVASAVSAINGGSGFLSTDVGRHIRIRGRDGTWRWMEITARVANATVTVALKSEPFVDTEATPDWRLGLWSDTTGWPRVGMFHGDRLWLGGAANSPDTLVASVVSDYERMSPTEPDGEVLDDNGIARALNARKLSNIRWIESDQHGLVVGTGSEEYRITAPSDENLTARNMIARVATKRGSAPVAPVAIDNQVLFVQRSRANVRELAYKFEDDNLVAVGLGQLASQFAVRRFDEIGFAQEPHSILWIRGRDSSLIGLTYNKDENVVAWHEHDLAGGKIESLAVLPDDLQRNDALWAVVIRTVNGQERRYIERMQDFWDFGYTYHNAFYVDSGLKYLGEKTDTIYGLTHLEGAEVYGLADGTPVGPLTVVDGKVTLSEPAGLVVLGLGYEGEVETMSLENGARDGTAIGKVKRVHNVSIMLWESFGGQIGTHDPYDGLQYVDIDYSEVQPLDELEEATLFSGIVGPFTVEPGYAKDGTLAIKKRKEDTLPVNIVAFMPQLNTQDR